MAEYPRTIHFTGLNTPVGIEWSMRNLHVIGTIPPEIDGAFFRAVPDPAHPPMFDDDIVLSGDGMIAKYAISGGKVDYAIRYVETERYLAEREARRALFGKYRDPFTDDPSVFNMDRTVANTTPVWHAGRLFMTKEDGLAYAIDPDTLQTIGRWDFGGKLRSQTFTAHPRTDPQTGEMFFFGYEAGGLCTPDVAYCIADAEGNLVSEQWFKQPYLSTMHDFAITERYVIFPVFPTTADLERLKAGGPHWAHQQDLESWVGIMPRYGKVEEKRWFKGPKGVSAFHVLNAFEEDDRIHLDLCLSDTNAFAFMREAGGIHRSMQEIRGGLTRWTFDLKSNGDGFAEALLGPPGDMPRLRDADQGRAYKSAWYMSMNPHGGPPLPGGPVGTAFNAVLRIEPDTGQVRVLGLGFGHAVSEPVHVPSQTKGHDGWLLMVVDREEGAGFASELWIVEADTIEAGPVARVPMPLPMRAQVHGVWVPTKQLETRMNSNRQAETGSAQ